MSFPTTSAITTFANEADGGPPPTADYENGPIGEGGMLVDTGICREATGTTGSAQLVTPYASLPVECWGTIGDVNGSPPDYIALYITNTAETAYYILSWDWAEGNFLTVFDQDFVLVHQEAGVDPTVPDMVSGYSFGFRAKANGNMEVWMNTGGGWTLRFTATGMSFPASGKIGMARLSGL